MGEAIQNNNHPSNQENESQQNVHNDISDNHNSSQKDNQELQIVINKNKQLFETLKSRRRVLNAGCLLMIFLMVIFIGLTIFSLIIKDKIPYKNVMANDYGVFEMRNEKSDILYFLFNTAELWCNTGIEVHKNEKLIITVSGIFNTEISHMHAKDSTIYWIQADGRAAEKGPKSKRDVLLRDHETLICRDGNPGCLLATVVSDKSLIDKWQKYEIDYKDFIEKSTSIKVVNKGTDYVVPHDGVLLFTVNDVVFTTDNIKRINELQHRDKDIDSLINRISTIDSLLDFSEKKDIDRRLGLERMWYNDNLGSFFIVIERPRA